MCPCFDFRDDKVINYAGRDGLRVSLDKSIGKKSTGGQISRYWRSNILVLKGIFILGGSADEAGFERPVSTLDIFNVTGKKCDQIWQKLVTNNQKFSHK